MTPLKARIAQAKERADKATPQEWAWFRAHSKYPDEVRLSFGDFERAQKGYSLWTGIRPNDAAFIAAARADVPYLADQLSRAVELIEEALDPKLDAAKAATLEDRFVAFLRGAP